MIEVDFIFVSRSSCSGLTTDNDVERNADLYIFNYEVAQR